MRFRQAIAAAVAVLVVAGCGGSPSPSGQSAAPDPNGVEVNPPGDIPDDQAFVRISPPGSDFSLTVPEGWSRTVKGGAVTFTDKLNSIRIEQIRAAGRPSVASTRSEEVPQLSATIPGFAGPSVSELARQAGPAVLLSYRAKAAPDPVTAKTTTDAVERYTFFHKGERVVLTLSGPVGADNVDPWLIVTDSLRWD